MLNCDACVTAHFIFTEPVTICDGRWSFNVVFISEDYVVINGLPRPPVNSQARRVFQNIKGIDLLGYLLKWTVINTLTMLPDFYEMYLPSQNSRM